MASSGLAAARRCRRQSSRDAYGHIGGAAGNCSLGSGCTVSVVEDEDDDDKDDLSGAAVPRAEGEGAAGAGG
ncbi:hypothetical protein HK405_002461, partial [Cladochytrium tenue]